MPGAAKKDLYIAKTLHDLNGKVGNEKIREGQCRMFAKTTEKLFNNAEHSHMMGDEERAYVLYMKYMNIIQGIRKTAEYKKSKSYYDNVIGVKNINSALEKAEELASSLENRYEELEAIEVSAKLNVLNTNEDSNEEVKNEESTSAEHSENNSEHKEEVKKEETSTFIQCEKLYELISDNTNLLLIDIRATEDYKASHIKYMKCINIPKDIIRAGCTVKHIEANLPRECEELWQQRGLVEFIILLDWVCNEESLQTGNSLRSLKDALYKWDQETVIKSEPLLLVGGFEEWLNMYPTFTTNSSIKRPASTSATKATPGSLEYIDYDLDLNFLKTPEQIAHEQMMRDKNRKNLIDLQNKQLATDKMPVIPDRKTKPVNKINDFSPSSNSHIINGNIIDPHSSVTTTSSAQSERNVTATTIKQLENTDSNNKQDKKPPEINRSSKPNLAPFSEDIVPANTASSNKEISPASNHQPATEEIKTDQEKFISETEAQVIKIHEEHETKQKEYEASKIETKRLILETEARRAKLETEKKMYEEMKELRFKEEKEMEDILKKKQDIEEELRKLDEEKMRKLAEQEQRAEEVSRLKKIEEEKKARLKREAEKLREERRKKEEAEKLKKQKEEQALKEQENEKLRKAKIKEEQQEAVISEKARLEKLRKLEEKNKMRDETKKAGDNSSEKNSEREPMLPVNWEKAWDNTQKKYYYMNHLTKKTQWERPTIQSEPGVYKTKLKSDGSGSSLKRSHSSPNIAKLMEEEGVNTKPVVSREMKPQPRQTPEFQREIIVSDAKVRNFNALYGNVGAGLTGLRNQGNTCYMNSTLQCMSNTAFLTSYIISDNYKYDINLRNKQGTGGEVAQEYAAVIKALWSGQYRSITPIDFKRSCARHCDTFAGYEQQDAQELVTYLLDWIHEDLNKVAQKRVLPEQNNDNIPDLEAAHKHWKEHKTGNDSVICDLFQGQTKSTIMCNYCGKKSITFETFFDLSVDIPSQSRCSLDDCIRSWSKEEKMTGDSRWKCPKCKVPREAIKCIQIWKLPPVLIIVLKRFNHSGMWRQKNSAYVDFPVDNVNFSPYVKGPKDKIKAYNLYAISNHYGTMEGGHYTAFCKNPNYDRWFKYDDHEVNEFSKSNIKTSAAYFLFYSSLPTVAF